jgi:tryptophan halogenase
MDQCGFDPTDWFVSVDATYKSGILFPDWCGGNKSVWHPFFMNSILENGYTMHDAWCKNKNYNFVA